MAKLIDTTTLNYYKHIPSGGSNGQVLKYGGSSGTAAWGTISTTDTYGDYVKE